jgi:Ca2+:H+ antiporter
VSGLPDRERLVLITVILAGQLGVAPLSRGTAVILLFVYACYLFFQLKSHAEVYNRPSEKVEKRRTRVGKGDATKGIAQMGGAMSASAGGQNQQQASYREPVCLVFPF